MQKQTSLSLSFPLPLPLPTRSKSLSHLLEEYSPARSRPMVASVRPATFPEPGLGDPRRACAWPFRAPVPAPAPAPARDAAPAPPPRRPPPEFSLTSPTLLRGPDSTSLSAMLGPAWNRCGSRRGGGGGGTSRAPGPRPHCSHGRLKGSFLGSGRTWCLRAGRRRVLRAGWDSLRSHGRARGR